MPPCPLVIAFVPLKCYKRNLQFLHLPRYSLGYTEEKMPWCPCPFKDKAYRPCSESNSSLNSTQTGKLPHRHKIVIAGNHEVTFDRQLMTEQNSHVFMSFATALQEVKQEDWKHIPSHLTNCTYLEDAEVNIMGFRIYGSPW